MVFNLGMTAAAAATHKHEFSSSPAAETTAAAAVTTTSSSTTPAKEHGYDLMFPLRYLHDQIQAFTGLASPSTQSTPDPSSSKDQAQRGQDLQGKDAPITRDGQEQGTSSPSGVDLGAGAEGVQSSGVAKSKTAYQICHPPPAKHGARFRMHRRTLVQLRTGTGDRQKRPAPVMELLEPAPPARTLTKSRARGRNHHAGAGSPAFAPEDLLVASCDSYRRQADRRRSSAKKASTSRRSRDGEESSDDEDGADHEQGGDVIASIRHGARDDPEKGAVARIQIGANVWEARELESGCGYEFVSTSRDNEVTKARWISKCTTGRKRGGSVGGSSPLPGSVMAGGAAQEQFGSSTAKDRKFRFAIMNPNARQHPVIAHLDRQNISVMDQYSNPCTTATAAAAPSRSPSVKGTPREQSMSSSTAIETPESYRTMVLVTALFVIIAEGWSEAGKAAIENSNSLTPPTPSSSSSPATAATASSPHPTSATSHSRRKSASISGIIPPEIKSFAGGGSTRRSRTFNPFSKSSRSPSGSAAGSVPSTPLLTPASGSNIAFPRRSTSVRSNASTVRSSFMTTTPSVSVESFNVTSGVGAGADLLRQRPSNVSIPANGGSDALHHHPSHSHHHLHSSGTEGLALHSAPHSHSEPSRLHELVDVDRPIAEVDADVESELPEEEEEEEEGEEEGAKGKQTDGEQDSHPVVATVDHGKEKAEPEPEPQPKNKTKRAHRKILSLIQRK